MDYKIVPYTKLDGVPTFKDSEIRGLYTKAYETGIGDALFHDGTIQTEYKWLQYVKTAQVMLYVIIAENNPIGFFWLNRIERTTAHCHFAAFPEVWGTETTVEMGKRAMRLLLIEMTGPTGKPFFDTIMGILPSTSTIPINYLKRVGLKTVGEIPNLLWSQKEEKPVTGTVMYITREELTNEDLH